MRYVLLCGASAAELARISLSPGAVAGVMRENSRQMQQAAAVLRKAGVPLRAFLAPYVDTVQLQNESAAFFGSRMLAECGEDIARQAKKLCEPFSLLRVFTADSAEALLSRHPLTERRRVLLQDAAKRFAEPDAALAIFSFSAPALDGSPVDAFRRRAQSREVLAFGEICARIAKKAGSELICCAGGELVLRLGEERQEELLQAVERAYAERMAPHCGTRQEKLSVRILRAETTA